LDLDLEISINKNGTPVIEIQRSRGGINMPMETKKGDDQAVCGVHGWKRGAGSQRRAENLTSNSKNITKKTKKKKKKKKKEERRHGGRGRDIHLDVGKKRVILTLDLNEREKERSYDNTFKHKVRNGLLS